jgi:hypothetical protein
VISVIALFVALGGTSYAVTQLPRNSVGTMQLKQGAVTTAKLKAAAVTSGKIAKGAVGEASIKDSAVTGAKVKDGSLAADDLTAGARAELRGTPLTSAAASSRELLLLIGDTETTMLSTTVTVTYPARLLIDGFVAAGYYDSGGGNLEWEPFLCWLTVDGARIGGTSVGGVMDGLLAGGGTVDTTVPLTGSADVPAGTHAVTATCLGGGRGSYEVFARELTVAAFGR